ncbi:trypsin, partial [Danaus plexippus plexippus]
MVRAGVSLVKRMSAYRVWRWQRKKIRYLSLKLDGRWRIEGHSSLLAPKHGNTAVSFGRRLLNIPGSQKRCRRLHACIVRRMALYGDSI